MPEIEVGPGEKAVVLVLHRPLFPHDGFVTHKAPGVGVWHADLVQSGQMWTAKTRKELFEQFARELLNKGHLDKKETPGRPKKDAKVTTLRLTHHARFAIDALAKNLKVDWGTLVSYLALKGYASMVEDEDFESILLIDQMSDADALTQVIREESFGKPKTHNQIMAEFEAKRQAELTELAQTMRLELEMEEETKKYVAKQTTDKLTSEEAAAERKIQRED